MVKSTKIVKYRDENGKLSHSILPIDAPDSDAALGVPIGIIMPPEWEPIRPELEEALAARGIVTPNDLYVPGASDRFRQALWSITRVDFSRLQQLNQRKD